MKRENKQTTLTVEIEGVEHKLHMATTGKPSGSITYECELSISNEDSFKMVDRFQIIYSFENKNHWAWTANTFSESKRILREKIANMFNSNDLEVSKQFYK